MYRGTYSTSTLWDKYISFYATVAALGSGTLFRETGLIIKILSIYGDLHTNLTRPARDSFFNLLFVDDFRIK